MMYFSLEKLLNFKGNRYELARACMEYAKKVRYLESDEYHTVGEKDALVALKAVLDSKIRYTLEQVDKEELEELEDFDAVPNRMPIPMSLGDSDDDDDDE